MHENMVQRKRRYEAMVEEGAREVMGGPECDRPSSGHSNRCETKCDSGLLPRIVVARHRLCRILGELRNVDARLVAPQEGVGCAPSDSRVEDASTVVGDVESILDQMEEVVARVADNLGCL